MRFYSPVESDYVQKMDREKSLTSSLPNRAGRDNKGHISSRRAGGGHKKAYRIINFQITEKDYGSEYEVIDIQYDPNRNVPIALCKCTKGDEVGRLIYVVRTLGISTGSKFQITTQFSEKIPGTIMPIGKIPVGMDVNCVELKRYKGAQIARSAGSKVTILGVDGDFVIIKLPSGEKRKINSLCNATIGEVANKEYSNISIGKAGRNRWKGIRPSVRGVAMNPVDHPLGGGEGKTSGGRHPVSPWGKNCKGQKTRRSKRTNVFIVSDRRKK